MLGERMADERVVIFLLAPLPRALVRPQLLRQLGDRLDEAARQQFVAARNGVSHRLRRASRCLTLTEAAVGRVQPVDDALHARLPDERLRLFRHEQVADVRVHAPLPHLVDAGGDRVGVDAEVPREEQRAAPSSTGVGAAAGQTPSRSSGTRLRAGSDTLSFCSRIMSAIVCSRPDPSTSLMREARYGSAPV